MIKSIALIRPNHDSLHISPSLGLGYLSAWLKKHGYGVLLIDALRDNLSNSDIIKLLNNNAIEIAGITCISPQYQDVVILSQYLKNNKIKVIIGGVHPTFLPHQTLIDTNADYVVCGEGEIAFLALLNNNLNNILSNGSRIKGAYSLSDLPNADSPFEKSDIIHNLDELPYPDWEQMNPKKFPPAPMGVFLKRFPVAPLITSRGCPYECKFCASTRFYEKKIRFRSPENVVGEMLYLKEKFGVKEFHFVDDSLNMKRDHIEKICNLIIEKGLNACWSCPNGIRADKIDDALVKLMKKAGCYYCAFGIESGNNAILKGIKKAETIETIRNAIEIVNKNGIGSGGAIIIGLPGETKETIKETLDFLMSTNMERAHIFMLSILPGCELWEELRGQVESSLSKEIFKGVEWTPEGLTKDDLSKAMSLAYRKFYLRPKILFRLFRYVKLRQLKYIFKRALEFGLIFRKHYKD